MGAVGGFPQKTNYFNSLRLKLHDSPKQHANWLEALLPVTHPKKSGPDGFNMEKNRVYEHQSRQKRKKAFMCFFFRSHYWPGTCLSSILVVEPSKRRPFPFKIRVIGVPGGFQTNLENQKLNLQDFRGDSVLISRIHLTRFLYGSAWWSTLVTMFIGVCKWKSMVTVSMYLYVSIYVSMVTVCGKWKCCIYIYVCYMLNGWKYYILNVCINVGILIHIVSYCLDPAKILVHIG